MGTSNAPRAAALLSGLAVAGLIACTTVVNNYPLADAGPDAVFDATTDASLDVAPDASLDAGDAPDAADAAEEPEANICPTPLPLYDAGERCVLLADSGCNPACEPAFMYRCDDVSIPPVPGCVRAGADDGGLGPVSGRYSLVCCSEARCTRAPDLDEICRADPLRTHGYVCTGTEAGLPPSCMYWSGLSGYCCEPPDGQ